MKKTSLLPTRGPAVLGASRNRLPDIKGQLDAFRRQSRTLRNIKRDSAEAIAEVEKNQFDKLFEKTIDDIAIAMTLAPDKKVKVFDVYISKKNTSRGLIVSDMTVDGKTINCIMIKKKDNEWISERVNTLSAASMLKIYSINKELTSIRKIKV